MMPGFVDLSKTPGANHRPVHQAGVVNQRRSWKAGQCHSALSEDIIQLNPYRPEEFVSKECSSLRLLAKHLIFVLTGIRMCFR